MPEKENKKPSDLLEESKNRADDDSDGDDGDDGGFTDAVIELTKKINKDNCYEHH